MPRLFSLKTKPALDHLLGHIVELLLLLLSLTFSSLYLPVALLDKILHHLPLPIDETLRVL